MFLKLSSLRPTNIFFNVCAFFIVSFTFVFQRNKYKKIQEERRAKIAAAFIPAFTRELTNCGDIHEAYLICKEKMAVPEWDRFWAFLQSGAYLEESKALKAAAETFNKTYALITKLQTHQLQTFFRKASLPEAFDRAFIIIWLYTFHKGRLPDSMHAGMKK